MLADLNFLHQVSVFCSAADPILLLLQDDASNGIPQGVHLKTNWPGRMRMGKHRRFCVGILYDCFIAGVGTNSPEK
jgi:hypothetical protein